jgi:hypothetical protein
MSLKASICAIALAAAAMTFSSPLISAASAQQRVPYPTTQPCKIVGAISHRCYVFHSDAAWRAGLSDYHGSNGG